MIASQGRIMSPLYCGFGVAEFSQKFFLSNSSLIRFSLASKGVEISSGNRANCFRGWGVGQQERISHRAMLIHEQGGRAKWAEVRLLSFFFFFFFKVQLLLWQRCQWKNVSPEDTWLKGTMVNQLRFTVSSPQFKASYQPSSFHVHLYYFPQKTGTLVPSGAPAEREENLQPGRPFSRVEKTSLFWKDTSSHIVAKTFSSPQIPTS